MFLFFSNKLGWAGSIAISLVLSLLLYTLFRFVFQGLAWHPPCAHAGLPCLSPAAPC